MNTGMQPKADKVRIRRRFSVGAGAVLAIALAGTAVAQPGESRSEVHAQVRPEARPEARAEVRIAEGALSGIRKGGVSVFTGIPYAEPPVGDLRWKPPVRHAGWQGVRAADHFGANCVQRIAPGGFGAFTHEYVPSGETSEDCLTLNVWAPARTRARAPVLVFIHGGGYSIGSGSIPIYNGEDLARQGVVVVTLNYRLGALGFLASPEFRGKGGGNFGLLDQVMALEWVKRNIAAFGGDPGRVTISGQSAGAASVHELVLAPRAKGLFRQVIPQSGIGLGLRPGLDLTARDKAEQNAGNLLSALGVSSMDEARKVPLETLLGGLAKARIGGSPYADGDLLPLDPERAFREGQYTKTPVLIGLTADEGSALNFAYRTTDATKYRALLQQRFGALAPEVERLYPVSPSGEAPFAQVIRDTGIASVLFWQAAHARTSSYPAYGYVFTHVEPGPDAALYGAFHTSEIPYIFGTLGASPERPFGDADRLVAQRMRRYWINFVKTGNPNGPGLPAWPKFTSSAAMLELGGTFGTYPPLGAEKLAVFRKHLDAGGSLMVF